MPELKHNFMKGRMNKDLDERLVPNGEYRDALNVEVLTSETGDIGSVQNCSGNIHIGHVTEAIAPLGFGMVTQDQEQATCVGSIVDNKNNEAYWLVADTFPKDWVENLIRTPHKHQISRDFIARYDKDEEKEYIILNDIYHVRNDILSIDAGTNQIEVESVEGLRVGMELHIIWITQPYSAAWYQTNDKVIITDLNPTHQALGLTTIIEVNQIPLGMAQPGNAVVPFDNTYINTIDSSMKVTFTAPRVLNFDRYRLITGINIVDDMLFWTDNHTEPKKININRCLQGTNQFVNAYGNRWHEHTDLFVQLQNKGPIEEKHITNIKRSPLSPPTLEMNGEVARFNNARERQNTTAQHANMNWWGTLDGITRSLYIEGTTTSDVAAWPDNAPMMNLSWTNRVDWRKGDIIIGTDDPVAALDSNGDPRLFYGDDIKIKLSVTDSDSTTQNPQHVWSASANDLTFEILAINQDITDCDNDRSTLKPDCGTWFFRLEGPEPIYEFKFPRFATRYKYEDGEYSTFSPFSELAFLPDRFNYHPKEGYNLGMTNHLRTLRVKDFVPKDIPLDVVEVDLLYKESDSPNIYTIKTFNSSSPEWQAAGSHSWNRSIVDGYIPGGNHGNFGVKTDLIHAVVESNQLLRPWDNVPRKALAQELTANRIIYGNYQQNYNVPLIQQLDVTINADRHPHEVAIREPVKSLKSLRTYQVGVVYKDFYGRETPVLSDYTSAVNLEKMYANKSNRLHIKVHNPAPAWADSFKYFVKETSNEYYNLAMDRWYDAGDENIWLSFPSEDRNKVDDETTIMLKKGDRRNDFVEEVPKYKILAIENEAPDYIKTVYTSMGFINMNTGSTTNPSDLHGHFGGLGNGAGGYGPFVGRKSVRIDKHPWEHSDLSSLQNPGNTILEGSFNERGTSLVLRFLDGEPGETGHRATAATQASKWYNITNISYQNNGDDEEHTYAINIDPDEHDGGFGNDILFLGDDAEEAGNIIENIHIEIGKKTLENKAEFDGRFFVKIHDDISIQSSIKQEAPSLSSNSQLKKDITVQLNHFRGPSRFRTGHDSAAANAHNIQWDLTHTSGTIFQEATVQTPHYNTDDALTGGVGQSCSTPPCPLYPPNSFEHPGVTSTPQDAISGYIGATPMWGWLLPISEMQVWEIYWEQEKNIGGLTNYTPNTYGWTIPSTSIPGTMPSMSPKTHRYPGSRIGQDDDDGSSDPTKLTLTNSVGSQALLPIPFRTMTEWAALMSGSGLGNEAWFIDSEPAVAYPSRNVITMTSGNDTSTINKFGILKTVGADIGQSTIDISHTNSQGITSMSQGAQDIANRLISGTVFSFTSDPENIKYEIGSAQRIDVYNYDWIDDTTWLIDQALRTNPFWGRSIFRLKLVEPGTSNPKKIGDGSAGVPGKDIYSPVAVHALDYVNTHGTADPSLIAPNAIPNQADETSAAGITFWEAHEYHQKTVMPKNPAIFETEPKEDIGLDIYYEISKSYPVIMNDQSNERYIPIYSHTDMYRCPHGPHAIVCGFVTGAQICPYIIGINTDPLNPLYNGVPTTQITWDVPQRCGAGDVLLFTTPEGNSVTATVAFNSGTTRADISATAVVNESVFLHSVVHGEEHIEGWNNCYSFGNGVESNRIRDLYNTVTIDKGVKASTTLAEQYQEETRGSGLIFSGIYNSKMKGVNRLNQFIMAEPITKELNPTYGSIQKLHQRDADLVTLCEDKVLRIDQRQSGRDALYNAEGNSRITATENVLGQTIPYLGDYGISKNPESFASEAFRLYFADKQRGAVLRLSRDGLTPISNYGMKNYFNENLLHADAIVGSYDTVKSLYNISLFYNWRIEEEKEKPTDFPMGDMLKTETKTPQPLTLDWDFLERPTISFREENNGWTSFKSFRPETGFSLNNKYYTTKWGELWEHHTISTISSYYGSYYAKASSPSTITVLFNDSPSSVKSFTTLNYEGSQSRIIENNFHNDGGNSPWTGQYYNSTIKDGWWCNNITTINEVTGNQTGTVKEFINKEGKWFNHIRGEKTSWKNNRDTIGGEGNVDTQEFSVQGIGNFNSITGSELWCGCTNKNALNYNPNPLLSDCNCNPPGDALYQSSIGWDICCVCKEIEDCGCTDSTVGDNPDINGNCNNNTSCTGVGCCGTDDGYDALNYNPLALINDGSCDYV